MSEGSEPAFADAAHPGTLDHSDILADDGITDEAREWYENAIPYAARLMWEAAQASERVRRKFTGEDAPSTTGLFNMMAAETPEKLQELHDLGLSMNQGGTAERMVRNELTTENHDE